MLNIGEIYCYSNKSFIHPKQYYTSKRRTGSGIIFNVIGSNIKMISLTAQNDGSRYKFMEGELRNVDFPNVNCTIYEGTALRDVNGKANSSHIIDYCKFNGVTWNSVKYLKSTEYTSRINGWYVPSAGELYKIYQNLNDILHALEMAKLTESSLYKLLYSRPKLISSTQAGSNEMYSLDFNTGKLVKTKKGGLTYSISIYKGKEDGGILIV